MSLENTKLFRNDLRIGVVGLGYVGLPMACLFASRYNVVGFDCNQRRIDEINEYRDNNAEISPSGLKDVLQEKLVLTWNPADLADCSMIIVCVPTPVDSRHNPDLTPLISASETVGRVMRPACTVVYESTVSPGTTEEICVPVLEKVSGLRLNRDFFVGYSPERVNPGDPGHSVRFIRKIVSGSTPEITGEIELVYNSVLDTPVFRTRSIRVAEAAKIIENTQRDVNIALINEFTRIFNALGIDTDEVLEAASTKWNFHNYRPGLVGGHCIGVDPYYLIHKAEECGVNPIVMKNARLANEEMPAYLADMALEQLRERGIDPSEAHILMLGFAFKPDCPDIRNTKCHDVYRRLASAGCVISVYDPIVSAEEVAREHYGLTIISDPGALAGRAPFDAIVRCTPHRCFERLDLSALKAPACIDTGLVAKPDITVSIPHLC